MLKFCTDITFKSCVEALLLFIGMVDLIKNFSPRLSREYDPFGSSFLVLAILKIAMLCGWTKFSSVGVRRAICCAVFHVGTDWLAAKPYFLVGSLLSCLLIESFLTCYFLHLHLD